MVYKKIGKQRKFLLISFSTVLLLIFVIILFFRFNVSAQGQIKFFSNFQVNNDQGGNDNWQNIKAASTQDLSNRALYAEFNTTNSAYIIGTAETAAVSDVQANTSSPVTTDNIATDTSDATTNTIVVADNNSSQLKTQSQILELSGFGLSPEEIADGIKKTRLGLSLAGKGDADDKLIIDYYYQGNWQNLDTLSLGQEISNSSHGDYFYYPLSLLSDQQDFSDLKIRLTYQGQGHEKVYLESLWLDMEAPATLEEGTPATSTEVVAASSTSDAYGTDSSTGGSDDSSSSPVSSTTLDTSLSTTTFSTSSEIAASTSVAENMDEMIKKTIATTTADKIENPVKVIRKIPKKYLEFSVVGQVINSTKKLDWYSDEFKIGQDDSKNNQINLKVATPNDLNSESKPKLIFSGTCQKKYFVVLAFAQANDYLDDPGKSIYNKALLCQNNSYYYELNDLPENLSAGTYYFLVAEQGTSGSWDPISAIQPVVINPVEK